MRAAPIVLGVALLWSIGTSSQEPKQKEQNKSAGAQTEQTASDKSVPEVAEKSIVTPVAPSPQNIPEKDTGKQKQNSEPKQWAESLALIAGFLAENWEKVITSIFSGMLAWFTYLLWRSTHLLWKEARESRRLAIASVNAAGSSARAASISADLAAKSLYILQRPIVVRSSTVSDIKGFCRSDIESKIGCIFVNRGTTPAIVSELYTTLAIAPIRQLPEPINPAMTIGESHPPSRLIARDTPERFDFQIKMRINQQDVRDAVLNGRGALFLLGLMRYRDIFDNKYLLGFCGRYDHSVGDFVIEGGEAYNYSKEDGPDTMPPPMKSTGRSPAS